MRIFLVLLLTSILLIVSCSGPVARKDANWSADTVAVNKMNDKVALQEIVNPDSALSVVLRATALARKIDYPAGLAWALFEHGNLLYRENRFNEAMDKYIAVLDMATQLNLTLLNADCLERMASIHLATDDPYLALKLYYDALLLYEKVADSLGIAKVYNILGVYKTDIKEYDSAKVYFAKAMAINEHTNQKGPLIENRGNLAYMYGRIGDLKKAEQIFSELAEELIIMKDSMSLPTTYFNLAELYQDRGRYDTTLIFLDKAIQVAEPVKDTVLLSTLYGNKGEIFLKTGKYDSASWYLSKSVACARAINDVETEAQALTYILRIDSVARDYKKALTDSRRIIVLNDTNAGRHLRNNLKGSELQYENEKRKSLIELQQLKIETAEKQRKWYMVLAILAVVAVVLIGLVLVLERKNHRKKKQIDQSSMQIRDLQLEEIRKDQVIDRLHLEMVESELNNKKRELVSNALLIEQRNEMLNHVIKKIQEVLVEQPGSDQVKVVKEIIKSIRMQLNVPGEVDLFNQQFAIVHEKFYSNLKQAHPDLTKSEVKFCAYLRLHLSGAHISNSLSVTPEAVKKTRYRIRKKLNLPPDISLEDYISGI